MSTASTPTVSNATLFAKYHTQKRTNDLFEVLQVRRADDRCSDAVSGQLPRNRDLGHRDALLLRKFLNVVNDGGRPGAGIAVDPATHISSSVRVCRV